ncbi:MAG: hypothetical protein JWM12_2746 [Ilumatobacteraceae bacterium]|nr:hypothetical protein [Ilumatobacteraceae bacterium]
MLLIEPNPAVESVIATRLGAAGHELRRCFDEIDDGPCRGVRDDARCPMHQPIDLTVVVRETDAPHSLGEMGAVCGERHRVPVVRVLPDDATDIVAVVQTAAANGRDQLEARYASVVRVALAGHNARVEAQRDAGNVRVSVHLPSQIDWRLRSALADRARRALRTYDPFVRTIDIAIQDDLTSGDHDEWFVDDGDGIAALDAVAAPRSDARPW